MSYTDYDFPHSHLYETDLRELIHKVENLWGRVNTLDEWKVEHEIEYQELKSFMDAIVSGNFPPGFEQTLRDWLDKYAVDIIGGAIKHVHFGLTNDGYFCAFIPENWSNVQFDTIDDFDDPLYGHLVLMYD